MWNHVGFLTKKEKHHQKSPFGLRFSTQNYSIYANIHSHPLYAVAVATKSDFVHGFEPI